MQEDIDIFPDPEKMQTLERMNNPDLVDMEQTWPTPEELLAAENRFFFCFLIFSFKSCYRSIWFF